MAPIHRSGSGLYDNSAFVPQREDVRGTPAEAAREERFGVAALDAARLEGKSAPEAPPVVMGATLPRAPHPPEERLRPLNLRRRERAPSAPPKPAPPPPRPTRRRRRARHDPFDLFVAQLEAVVRVLNGGRR